MLMLISEEKNKTNKNFCINPLKNDVKNYY